MENILAVLCLLILPANTAHYDPTKHEASLISLRNGTLKGYIATVFSDVPDLGSKEYWTRKELKFRKYLNVPYAEPPIGDLRFSPPVQLQSRWEDVYDATKQGKICIQNEEELIFMNQDPTLEQCEDCLNMNIYAPLENDIDRLKAVMILLVGEEFQGGANTSPIDGSVMAVLGDVIVVVPNYRLGALGFLSTEDDLAPGNLGLRDQQMVFKWVQENIALFGGDPDRVTILGHAGGSKAAIMHAISPANYGLFKRIIAQSGFINAETPYDRNTKGRLLELASSRNCTVSDRKSILDCLRKVDAKKFRSSFLLPTPNRWLPRIDNELVMDYERFLQLDSDDYVKPIIEPAVEPIEEPYEPYIYRPEQELPKKVIQMLTSIDFLIGMNSHEGYIVNWYLFGQPSNWDDVKQLPVIIRLSYFAVAQFYLKDYKGSDADELARMLNETILDAYHGLTPIENQSMIQLIKVYNDFITDITWLAPMDLLTHVLDKFNLNKYMYYFKHRPSQSDKPSFVLADHMDELPFMLGLNLLPDPSLLHLPNPQATEQEKNLSYQMLMYWTNFAKTGDANLPNIISTNWYKQRLFEPQYLELDTSPYLTHMKKGYIKPRASQLFNKLLPKIVEKTSSCYTKKKKVPTATLR